MASKMLPRCAGLVPPGVQLRYAFTGQSGLNPTWRFVTFWLMFANKGWIIATSNDQTFIFQAGRTKFTFDKPKRLAATFRRDEVQIPPRLHGAWTRLTFGQQRIWVSRRTYPAVSQAFGVTSAQ